MTKLYTVILSDAEDKALNHVAISAQEWIDNMVHERCRVAIDDISTAEIQRRLSLGETISGSKEDIVLAAPIETAAQIELAAQLQRETENRNPT